MSTEAGNLMIARRSPAEPGWGRMPIRGTDAAASANDGDRRNVLSMGRRDVTKRIRLVARPGEWTDAAPFLPSPPLSISAPMNVLAAPARYATSPVQSAPAVSRATGLGRTTKRAFDLFFASAALIAAGGLLVPIALAISASDRGPVFFRHERVGQGGRTFDCLKFRTMVVDAERRLREHLATDPAAAAEFARMRKLSRDPRIVPGVGHFLRRTSLDELPQLLNVIRGEMSLVGPRPVTREEIPRYGRGAWDYYSVRPGITGLWQVSGRNELSFQRRVEIDSSYVREWSFPLDIWIMWRTVFVLASGRGAC